MTKLKLQFTSPKGLYVLNPLQYGKTMVSYQSAYLILVRHLFAQL